MSGDDGKRKRAFKLNNYSTVWSGRKESVSHFQELACKVSGLSCQRGGNTSTNVIKQGSRAELTSLGAGEGRAIT